MLFVLKEGIAGLIRSRFYGFVAVLTLAISLILIGIFLIITVNLGRFVEHLRSRVELEVFLDDSLDDKKIQTLATQIGDHEGVEEINFVSKEMAILEYKNLFKDQESDYFEVLGYNPLPASFRVKLKEAFRNSQGAEGVFDAISALPNVSAEDVVYRREYLVLLEKYIRIAISLDFVIGSIVCLSALLLVSNNIRLIIMSKQRIIETMKLVGATSFLIRMPLYIQGTIQGLLGGALATLFLYSLLKLSAIETPGLITVDWQLYLLIISFGALLGMTGSFSAVRRYL